MAALGWDRFVRTARSRRLRGALAAVAVVTAGSVTLASATPAVDGNADLPSTCGLDVTLVLDDSASINSAEAEQVRSAAQLFADALVGTPSQLKVVTFASRAQGVAAGGGLTSNVGNVVFRDPASYTAPTSGAGSGGTNWDDGLEVVRRSSGGVGDLVVFVTDGDPTYRNEDEPDGHANDGSHALDGDGSSVSAANLSAAVYEAAAIKAAGAHMFGIGVGLSAAASEQRLNDVTGDEELTLDGLGNPNIPFGQADYTIAPSFAQLQSIVSAFVRDLCAPSLNVTKYLQKADGSTVRATGAEQWSFSASVSPSPTAWQTPVGASGASATQSTNGTGGASFKWSMDTNAAVVDLTETAQPGWVYNGAVCTRNLLDGSAPTVIFDTVGQNAVDASEDAADLLDLTVGLQQAVNCDVHNRQIRPATIQVAKQTVPAGLDDGFDFTLSSGQTSIDVVADVAHGETGTFDPVPPGTYAVTEGAVDGYSTTSSTCDLLATTPVETVPAGSLVVGEGENWRCTFVNQAAPGTMTVVKDAVGADGTFSFTSNVPGLGDFALATFAGTASTATVGVPVGSYAIAEQVPAAWDLTGASCTGQQTPGAVFVGPGQDVVCRFTNTAPDPTIVVTKSAGSAAVGEPGGPVAFTVTVTNTSVEPVTIATLTDAIDGGPQVDLTTVAGPITATDCDALVGEVLTPTGPGASATCTFTATVAGNGGDVVSDVVTVTAYDSSQTPATDADDASVAVTDVAPSVSVTKTPSVSSLPEPGGDVTYTLVVSNTGVEPLTVDSLSDVIEGGAPIDVAHVSPPVSSTTCGGVVGTTIGVGASATCAFTISHVVDRSDLPDGDLDDTVTVTASDDDGSTEATASAEVVVTDVKPTLTVTKVAAPTTVAETAPGQTRPVLYTVTIQNTSPEPVAISSITDAVEGAPAVPAGGTCAALVGTTLAAQSGTSCSFTLGVAGNAGDVVDDIVEVAVADDDGNSASATDDASVAITDLASSILVAKTAAPASVPEPGGQVTYTVVVTNRSAADAVTIGSIVDAVDGGAPVAVGGTCAALIGTTLAPGGSASCTFVLTVSGDAGDVVPDTVTVTGTDDDGGSVSGSGDERVTVTDVPSSITVEKTASVGSVPEPGGQVTYTVVVTNTSAADAVTIGSIVDAVDGGAPVAVGGTCAALIGTTLAPGGSASCTFALTVSGDAGDVVPDTVTVTGTDDDGAPVSAGDSAVVDVTDTSAAIVVVKTPSVDSIAEPGGDVTYTVDITNTSAADAVAIDTITDAVGAGAAVPVAGTCDDLVGQVLTPGATVSCTFTMAVSGDAGDAVVDTVTVTGTDDDDAPVTGSDSAVVDITDVPPTGTVTKVATPTSVAEPGGPVEFAVTVTNTSPVEAATVTAITDLVDGTVVDVTQAAPPVAATTCAVGAVLAPGGTYSCTFTLSISGADAGDVVVDEIAVTLVDDDGGSVTPTDTETVVVTDVLPSITVTKDNGGAVLPAPGGPVTFDVVVANASVEPVTLTALTDSVAGGVPFDVTVTDPPVISTSCVAGGVLAVGGTYSCSFTVVVAGDEATTVPDVVEATAVDDEGNEATAGDDAVTTVTASADVSIDKRVVGDGLIVGRAGAYELEVANEGPSAAAAVVVVDTVPEGLVPRSGSGDGWACAIDGQTVTCQRASLAAGASSVITVAVDVTEAVAGREVTNVAEVSAETEDPDPTNNRDEERSDVPEVIPEEEEQPPTSTTSTPTAVVPGNVDQGTLPRTGGDPSGLIVVGACLLGAGAVVLMARRRAGHLG